MNELVKSLIQPLLEDEQKNIALVPGGYKPPTGGHFYIVNEIAKRAEIDEVIVLIGHKERDGITKEDSIQIWDIYKKYLPSNVTIRLSSTPSPIHDIHKIIGENPQNFYYPVVGMRNQDDIKDQQRFDSLKTKFTNFKPIVIPGDPEISGTKAREAILNNSYEKFQKYLPLELEDSEREKVWNIIKNNPISDVKDPYGINQYARELMKENITYSQHINYKQHIKDLLKYMLNKGMNIKPLPKIIFKHGDTDNAKNFLGKTAYYNPTNMEIVLYTEGRHPKDLVRSFSHEMIHHIQNIEGRLGEITTTNTQEDDHLNQLEEEANLKGTMTFRNWTDSLNENKQVGVIYHYTTFENGLKILQSNELKADHAADSTNTNPIYAVSFTRDKRFHNNHNIGFDIGSSGQKPQVRFTIDGDKLSNKYKIAPYVQDALISPVFRKNSEHYEAEERVVSNKPYTILLSNYLISIDVLIEYKKPNKNSDFMDDINYEMYTPIRAAVVKFAQDNNLPINLIVNKNGDLWPDKAKQTLIQKILNWFSINEANLKGTMTFRNWTNSLNKDKFSKKYEEYKTYFIKEPFTEAIIGDKIYCDNCDWDWNIKDGGDDLFLCHECGHDNTPKSLSNTSIDENTLNEGRYDKISNELSSQVFTYWKSDYEEGKSISTYEGNFENKDLYIEVIATIKFTPGHNKLTVDGGTDSNNDYLELNFEIDPKLLPGMWSEISMNLKDVVRHEIEHLTHGEGDNLNPNKYIEDDSLIRDMINMELLPKSEYFKLQKEIDANLQGMYFRAKKERVPLSSVINTYLDAQDISPEEKEQILNIWRIRGKSLSLSKF
jgi:hypothetical protein